MLQLEGASYTIPPLLLCNIVCFRKRDFSGKPYIAKSHYQSASVQKYSFLGIPYISCEPFRYHVRRTGGTFEEYCFYFPHIACSLHMPLLSCGHSLYYRMDIDWQIWRLIKSMQSQEKNGKYKRTKQSQANMKNLHHKYLNTSGFDSIDKNMFQLRSIRHAYNTVKSWKC